MDSNVRLMKKLVTLEGGKSFYTFYLRFANGETLKIQPNSWVDDKKVRHSNYDKLSFVADSELPFDK